MTIAPDLAARYHVDHQPGAPISNSQFAINGINHLALVCGDVDRTIEFYTQVLGMPLTKIIRLGTDRGYHFFFGLGNGDHLAFFWYAGAPDAAPGIASPRGLPGKEEIITAVGSMNHIAFNIAEDKFDEYRDRLVAKGVEVAELMHDDSPSTIASQMGPDVWVRSFYFLDPDGILLEFAAWTNAGTLLSTDQRVEVDADASPVGTVTQRNGAAGPAHAIPPEITAASIGTPVP